ncbi:hypothetical protein [Nocardioides zeae]
MTTVGDLLVEFREKPGKGEEPPVLTLTERNGFVRQADRFNKRLATEDISNYKVVRRNDIAFNPYLLWAGAVAQNTIVEMGIISPLYPTFRVRDEHDPRYVARLLLTPQLIGSYDGIAFGSVPRRRRSSVTDFLNLSLAKVPSLPEQRRIAAILDHADALRAKRRQVITHLDSLTSASFLQAFGLPQSWPTRWPMGTIGDIAASVDYGTSGKAGPAGEWPILRMGNVTDDGRLNLGNLKYIDLSLRRFLNTRCDAATCCSTAPTARRRSENRRSSAPTSHSRSPDTSCVCDSRTPRRPSSCPPTSRVHTDLQFVNASRRLPSTKQTSTRRRCEESPSLIHLLR